MAEPASRPPARRWPLLPTLLVAAAVATMVALGLWQIARANEKAALIALYQRNAAMSATTAMPAMGPVPAAALFRRSSAVCLSVTRWREVGGRAVDGTSGYRFLAECRSGAEGPGFVADMGLAEDPQTRVAWRGGRVEGVISEEPVVGGLWAVLTGSRPVPRPMLVASDPAPGLMPSHPPDPAALPNSHVAYAVQWFLFALAAAAIYVLALRQRWRRAEEGAAPAPGPAAAPPGA